MFAYPGFITSLV